MHSTLLSKIYSRPEIRHYLDWHYEQYVPLRLMFESTDGQLPAYLKGFDEAASTLDVMSMGVPKAFGSLVLDVQRTHYLI